MQQLQPGHEGHPGPIRARPPRWTGQEERHGGPDQTHQLDGEGEGRRARAPRQKAQAEGVAEGLTRQRQAEQGEGDGRRGRRAPRGERRRWHDGLVGCGGRTQGLQAACQGRNARRSRLSRRGAAEAAGLPAGARGPSTR